jgi:3-mercaptopyruvate sulfurtransferase SseA
LSLSTDNVPRISKEELKALIDSGVDIVIVDNSPSVVYNEGHIKGAISLPWSENIVEDDNFGLPHGKPIITYCDCGEGEGDSADVACQLLALGFDDVKTLECGWSAWLQAGYPAEAGA